MKYAWITSLFLVVAMGCNGAPVTDAGPRRDSGTTRADSGRTDSGMTGTDSGPRTDSGGPTDSGPPTDSGNMVTLTFTDAHNWCAITVNGTAVPAGGTPHTYMFPVGTVVPLTGTDDGSGTFVWGFWLGTDGDIGPPNHDTAMSTTVTMSSNRTVKSCCPFDNVGRTGCGDVTL